MILLIGVMPFLEQQQGLLVPIFMLVIIFAVLDTLELPKRFFRICVLLGIMAFVFHVVGKILSGAQKGPEGLVILVTIGMGGYAVFLLIAVGAMIGKIFTQTQETVDTIWGGIAVYFLLGIFWACLYRLLLHLDPLALAISNYDGKFSTILYFSFTTLTTTIGYGDIVPLTGQARILTIFRIDHRADLYNRSDCPIGGVAFDWHGKIKVATSNTEHFGFSSLTINSWYI